MRWFHAVLTAPTLSHTFTGHQQRRAANIRQWDHRYIPGEMEWWRTWSWAASTNMV
ncbi:hypothetical protein OK016_17580 [Vibrio chagasii]|nr:hypothetical protein [Vibrio chagasii]